MRDFGFDFGNGDIQSEMDLEAVKKVECKFDGCSKDADERINYTDGKRDGGANICKDCKQKSLSERPLAEVYTGGNSLTILRLWWKE